MPEKQKIYRQYGLTDEDFKEIAEFYMELLRIDPKREKQKQLVRILHGSVQKRIEEEQMEFENKISQLETLKSKF